MKYLNYLLLFTFMVLCSNTHLFSQLEVKIMECTNVKAQLLTQTDTDVYNFWLEKQIAPGVWSEQHKTAKKQEIITYDNLKPGVYRIGVLYRPNTLEKLKASDILLQKEMSESFEILQDCFLNKPAIVASSIAIYPNPSTGIIYSSISDYTTEKQVTMSLIDISGNVLHETFITDSKQLIDINFLNHGIFFIQIKVDGQPIFYTKLVLIKK